MGIHPQTESVFEQMVAVSITNGMSAVMTQAAHANRQNATYAAMGGVIGSLAVMTLTGAQAPNEGADEDFDPGKRITADTLLFFAILAATAARDTRCIDGQKGMDGTSGVGVQCEFGPSIVFDALEIFERATGRKIDNYLPKGMVEAARDKAAHAKAELDALFSKGAKLN